MDEQQVVEKLLQGDEEFRRLYEAHRELDRKVSDMEGRNALLPEEELEIKRLKKVKLSLKDKIELKKKKFLESL